MAKKDTPVVEQGSTTRSGDLSPNDVAQQVKSQTENAKENVKASKRRQEEPEEPLRTEAAAVLSGNAAATFAGFPKTKYHPVLGAKSAKDPNESASLFQPEHDWFDTPGEADMHRTHREAELVIHHNTREKLNGIAEGQDKAAPVRLSVQAQESMDSGNAEPV
jgi:hypothetical protein